MVSQSQEEYDAEIREWAKRQAEWDKPGWDVWGTRREWRRRKTTPFARPTGQRHDRDLHQDRHGRPHREPTAGADYRAILAGRPRSTCSQEML